MLFVRTRFAVLFIVGRFRAALVRGRPGVWLFSYRRRRRRGEGGNPVTARGQAIAEVLRSAFDALAELDKTAPADVDALVATTVAHLRSWRPEAVSPLGTLPPPERIEDPRGDVVR